MYAKKIKPPRAKETVMAVKSSLKVAKTDEEISAYIKGLSQVAPELASLQIEFEQREHAHLDEVVGDVAEVLLDQGKFDEMLALSDWYEEEKPDDEQIVIYLHYHFPEIAKELVGEAPASTTTEATDDKS